jgi:hypothetical protein
LYIHSCVDGHLGWFHLLVPVKNAEMNTGEQISLSLPLVYILKLTYLGKCQTRSWIRNGKFDGHRLAWSHKILKIQKKRTESSNNLRCV